MPKANFPARARVQHELKSMGFGGLEDTHLFDQIAVLYKTHDQFRGLLMSVEPEKRALAYESLRGKLCFTPKPLDVYEAEMKTIAEHQQLPTWNRETFMPEDFRPPDETSLSELAQEAIAQTSHEEKKGFLEMVCTRCTFAEYFKALRRKEAVKKAHEAGWRWEEKNGSKKTWCPKHVPDRLTMELSCTKCFIVQRIRAWDEQDGYQKALLAGWAIGDSAICPECAMKKATVQ